jgi:hypothetical protein
MTKKYHFRTDKLFRREEAPLYLTASVHWSVGPLVRPHITSKTSYVAIVLRRGGGRGKLVTSLFLRA